MKRNCSVNNEKSAQIIEKSCLNSFAVKHNEKQNKDCLKRDQCLNLKRSKSQNCQCKETFYQGIDISQIKKYVRKTTTFFDPRRQIIADSEDNVVNRQRFKNDLNQTMFFDHLQCYAFKENNTKKGKPHPDETFLIAQPYIGAIEDDLEIIEKESKKLGFQLWYEKSTYCGHEAWLIVFAGPRVPLYIAIEWAKQIKK